MLSYLEMYTVDIKLIHPLTYYIYQRQKFTEKISVGPEIMMFEVRINVVKNQLLLQSLFTLRNNAKVQIHCESPNLYVFLWFIYCKLIFRLNDGRVDRNEI